METKNLLSGKQNKELIKFTMFEQKEEDIIVKRSKADTLSNDEKKRKVEVQFFKNRQILEGLDALIYEPTKIVGSIFKRVWEEDPSSLFPTYYYYQYKDVSVIKNKDTGMPELKTIKLEDANHITHHTVDEKSIGVLSSVFPFFAKWDNKKCAELTIFDHSTCHFELSNLNNDVIEKIKKEIEEKSLNINDFFFIQTITISFIKENIMKEFKVGAMVDGGVYAKIDGKFFSSVNDTKKETKISGIKIPLKDL